MAPVKPMGTDSNPKTRQGVTGFEQEYNQEPGPRQDLNPDAVTDGSVLPKPLTPAPATKPRAAKTAKAKK